MVTLNAQRRSLTVSEAKAKYQIESEAWNIVWNENTVSQILRSHNLGKRTHDSPLDA